MAWSELPDDILDMISKKVFSVIEFKRLGSICRGWRLIDSRHKFVSIVDFIDPNLTTYGVPGHVRTVYLSRAVYFRVTLSSSSTKGWMMKSDGDCNLKKLRIVDTFSRNEVTHMIETINLYDLTAVQVHESYAVLQEVNANQSLRFKKVVVVNNQVIGIGMDEGNIIQWDGYESWTSLQQGETSTFCDIVVHKERAFILDSNNDLWVIGSSSEIHKSGPSLDSKISSGHYGVGKLVSCCDTLYLVIAVKDNSNNTVAFQVYQMHHDLEWVEAKSLGSYALLMATDTSLSVVASEFHECSPNSIYFKDGEDNEEETKVFDMVTGAVCLCTPAFLDHSRLLDSSLK